MKILIKIFLPALLLLLISCHKKKDNTILEQFFEDNILDQSFVITHANDESADLTANYTGYKFVLKKGNDYYHGPLKVTFNSSNYNGTWSSNEDYSKLNIQLPSVPSDFIFLNRDWRFTSKALPELKFAPWGSTANIQLTMKRQ